MRKNGIYVQPCSVCGKEFNLRTELFYPANAKHMGRDNVFCIEHVPGAGLDIVELPLKWFEVGKEIEKGNHF